MAWRQKPSRRAVCGDTMKRLRYLLAVLLLLAPGHAGAQQVALRATLQTPVSNPFYGQKHTAEQRERWSLQRSGTNTGEANPNFGKFGPEHPSYGRTMSDDARRALSEARSGSGNPNFGKSASPETRAKMSAARRGRPMPSSRRSAHTRYHTKTGAWSSRCGFCDTIVERQFALLVIQGDEEA